MRGRLVLVQARETVIKAWEGLTKPSSVDNPGKDWIDRGGYLILFGMMLAKQSEGLRKVTYAQ
jgi:hypothetical protein